jgi:quinoprotein glucose dehydrogenase
MRSTRPIVFSLALALLVVPLVRASNTLEGLNVDWGVYRGDPGGGQYSELAQIHAANVHRCSRPGSTAPATPPRARRCTRTRSCRRRHVRHDAQHEGRGARRRDRPRDLELRSRPAQRRHRHQTAQPRRAYWKGEQGERIFHFVATASTRWTPGRAGLVTSFGRNGFIDLRENLGVDPAGVTVEMTSPGAVYRTC